MNSYLDLELETERLTIRAWSEDDAEAAFRIYGDSEVARYLTGAPELSVETQLRSLRLIRAAYARLDRGMGSFPLFAKATGEMVGAVLLKPLPRSEDIDAWRTFRDDPSLTPPIHEIEVGWHLGREHWGHGYATESARRMVEYGFNELGLKEIHAVLYKENARSRAVAERLGMRHLGQTDAFYGVEVEHYVLP